MRSELKVWSFRKIHEIEGEIQGIKYFVLQVKYPSLWTDRKQTCTIYIVCAESDRCVVW